VHDSATSQIPAAARQAVPACPGACAQTPLAHWSVVHGLLSSVQAVPSAFTGLEQAPVAGLQVPAR
jgi:hypothetical protein